MIINLNEAASLLKMSPEGLRRKVKIGEIPGAKPGKCWIFIEDDINQYIRNQYKNTYFTHIEDNDIRKKKCQFSSVKTQKSIGSTSQARMVKEYERLLGQ